MLGSSEVDACGHGGRPPPAPSQGETRSEVGQAEVRRPGGPRCHARRLAIRIHSAVRAGCWAPSGATFISCPFSGALGKWEMGNGWDLDGVPDAGFHEAGSAVRLAPVTPGHWRLIRSLEMAPTGF